jgi:hypothetical protein
MRIVILGWKRWVLAARPVDDRAADVLERPRSLGSAAVASDCPGSQILQSSC